MALNINGTTGISGVDGSASAPALQGTDSNTGINFASDTVNINTGGQTRATVDSSGNMLIGATSASGKLHVEDSGELNSYFIGNTSTLGARLILQNKNATANSYNAIEGTDSGGQSTSIIKFYNADNANNEGFLTFETRPSAGLATERMRIESDGKMKFGTTSSQDGENYHFYKGSDIPTMCINHASSGTTPCLIIRHGRGGLSGFDGKAISFRGNDGTEEGSIVIGTTNTAYNTSSDYRLKENEVLISDGITRLKTLKPYRFNFKKDTETTVDGFFAHEVTAVPEAITGTKDEVDSDNNPIYQGIDQSKLVPLLTAALQEAIAKIEVLETKVAALEAG